MSGVSVGTALAVGSAGIGAVGSIMNASNMSSAMGAQTAALQEQEQLAMAQWNRYMTEFAPLENAMVTQAEQPANKQAGYLQAEGQLNKSYADLEANTQRSMAEKYPGGSGMSTGIKASQERGRIEDNANLSSSWNQQRWNQMMGIAGYGRGLTSNAMQGYQSAASGFGQQAGMYGNLMQSSAYGLGSSINSLNNSGGLNSMYPSSWFGGGGGGSGNSVSGLSANNWGMGNVDSSIFAPSYSSS
jgi:hypothetical protein